MSSTTLRPTAGVYLYQTEAFVAGAPHSSFNAASWALVVAWLVFCTTRSPSFNTTAPASSSLPGGAALAGAAASGRRVTAKIAAMNRRALMWDPLAFPITPEQWTPFQVTPHRHLGGRADVYPSRPTEHQQQSSLAYPARRRGSRTDLQAVATLVGGLRPLANTHSPTWKAG